jgi:glycosyltransferase involved in cell wall biosynthesis
LNDTVILTDTINPTVISLAVQTANKFHLPIIGLCTDSPSNISGTSKAYAHFLLGKSKNLDGYIALTDSLGELFNINSHPQLILEGVIEDKLPTKVENTYGKYFFFGGALLPRYGIYQLIEAFKSINNEEIKLLICGHHADKKKLEGAIKDNHNIQFLGLLPVNKVLELEQNALLNINPRPYSEDLDRYSIPSKTLEYLSSGALTLSVRNSKLQCNFADCALWSKSHEVNDIKSQLEKALSLSEEERKSLGNKARERVLNLYSLSAVNKKLVNFISYFNF